MICVDWEAGALIPNYVRAVANTRLVGKQLAMLIRGLTERGLTLDKVHLIGFSLGAHVAGFAGAEIKNISRITGRLTCTYTRLSGDQFGESKCNPFRDFRFGSCRTSFRKSRSQGETRRDGRPFRRCNSLEWREPDSGRFGVVAAHGTRGFLSKRWSNAKGLYQLVRRGGQRYNLV